MSFVSFGQFWGRNIEASSPNLNLFLAVLFHSLELVEALESSIVSFVESPVLVDRDVVAVKFISSVVKSLDSSRQDGSIADVELKAVLLQRLACFDGLLDS